MKFNLSLVLSYCKTVRLRPVFCVSVLRQIQRILLLAALLIPNSALADKYEAFYQLGYTMPKSGQGLSEQIQIRVISRCIGSYVVYKIHNLGNRWKERVNIAIFKDGDDIPLIFRDILMDRKQTATFKVFTGVPYEKLVLRISPRWLKQSIHHVSKHTPKKNLKLSQIPQRRKQSIRRKVSHFVQ